MRTVKLGVVLLATAVAAQEPGRVEFRPVAGATATAVGVCWPHGFDDDPADACGLARVLVEARLERARAAVPGLLASGFLVGDDYALAFGVVPGGDASVAAAFAKALADDTAPLADEALAVWIARGALAADDDENVYPGPLLRSRARRALAAGSRAGHAVAGSARRIAGLTPAFVRARLAEPVGRDLAALGLVTDDLRRALTDLGPGLAGALPPRAPLTLALVMVTAEPTEETNSRADAPYVAAAFAAPPPSERAAFAVACEVARGRAQRTFRNRGREAMARAPFVDWSWLRGDPIAVFCRRGEDPEKLLPGQRPFADAATEAAATTAELRAFLADLRATPASDREVAAAAALLRAELALPTPEEPVAWAAEPMLLPGRLQTLLLLRRHGLDLGQLAAVGPEQVAMVVTRYLDPVVASWHRLLPESLPGRTFRRR